jgi:transposase
MKPYSLDFREKIVSTIEKGESSYRETAQRFSVSKSYVQKLVALKRTEGHLIPQKQGGSVSPAIE